MKALVQPMQAGLWAGNPPPELGAQTKQRKLEVALLSVAEDTKEMG